jgi:hypothetical protein
MDAYHGKQLDQQLSPLEAQKQEPIQPLIWFVNATNSNFNQGNKTIN